MIVRYEPAARAEVTVAVRWYLEAAGVAVAAAFEAELNATVELLVRFPRLGKPGQKASRRLRLNGFPYTLHYRLDGELIRILAVANQRRRPGYWAGRVT